MSAYYESQEYQDFIDLRNLRRERLNGAIRTCDRYYNAVDQELPLEEQMFFANAAAGYYRTLYGRDEYYELMDTTQELEDVISEIRDRAQNELRNF